MRVDELRVKAPEGLGDTVMSTRVLKALRKNFPNTIIKLFLDPNDSRTPLKKSLLNLVCREYRIDVVIGMPQDPFLDLTKYQYFLPNIRGIHYSTAMLECAEDELARKFDICTVLDRGETVELHLTEKQQTFGREIVRQLEISFEKPVLWFHAHAHKLGGTNRTPSTNWWQELISELNNDFVLFEILSPQEMPVDVGLLNSINDKVRHILQQQGWNSIMDIPPIFKAAIMKYSVGGIAVDSMAKDLSAAVGNFRVILVLGSTHPLAALYPGYQVSYNFVEGKECFGCGNHGYIPSSRISFAEEVMSYRSGIPDFSFDEISGCRKGITRPYECLSKIRTDKVAAMAKVFKATWTCHG